MRHSNLLVVLAFLATAGQAAAAGDAALGENSFKKCAACHDVSKGINKVGPTLKGVVGRAASAVPGFAYSEASKASGLTWDEATLAEYLKNPKAKMPGTKMAFAGIKNDEEIQNIIAYLALQK